MKWLVAYSVRVNGQLTIRNVILPEALPPMNWIAIANREHEKEADTFEYALINFWQASDYDSSKWLDDGTGYLKTKALNRNKETEEVIKK
jgi:hypothetical protein